MRPAKVSRNVKSRRRFLTSVIRHPQKWIRTFPCGSKNESKNCWRRSMRRWIGWPRTPTASVNAVKKRSPINGWRPAPWPLSVSPAKHFRSRKKRFADSVYFAGLSFLIRCCTKAIRSASSGIPSTRTRYVSYSDSARFGLVGSTASARLKRAIA